MKKFIALLAVVLMLPCIALADPAAILASYPEEVMTFERDSQVNAWEGKWVLRRFHRRGLR